MKKTVKTQKISEGQASAPALSLKTPLEIAYNKFMQATKGTPEHEQAGDELVDVIWSNCK